MKGKYFIFVSTVRLKERKTRRVVKKTKFQIRHKDEPNKMIHSYDTMSKAREKRDELNG